MITQQTIQRAVDEMAPGAVGVRLVRTPQDFVCESHSVSLRNWEKSVDFRIYVSDLSLVDPAHFVQHYLAPAVAELFARG